MSRKLYVVELSEEQRKSLEKVVNRGRHSSEKFLRALVLLNVDRGLHQTWGVKTDEQITQVLPVCMRTVGRIKKQFVEEGQERVLQRPSHPRPDKRRFTGDLEAHLVALSCSTPPPGHARWSLRLLADKLVELEHLEEVSHETVRQVLKKTKSSPGKSSSGSSRRKKAGSS
jgi:hypothetical protein